MGQRCCTRRSDPGSSTISSASGFGKSVRMYAARLCARSTASHASPERIMLKYWWLSLIGIELGGEGTCVKGMPGSPLRIRCSTCVAGQTLQATAPFDEFGFPHIGFEREVQLRVFE